MVEGKFNHGFLAFQIKLETHQVTLVHRKVQKADRFTKQQAMQLCQGSSPVGKFSGGQLL